jgi:aspartyl-tRNA(Asn)/glutamyl-tRNA(Gln) amidotransferase subunit A
VVFNERRRKYPGLTPVPDWSRRIGVPAEYNIEELSESVREAWNRCLSQLEAQGDTIIPISLPHTKAALAAYYVLAPAEASSNLAKYDGVRYGIRSESQREDEQERQPDSGDSGDADDVLYSHTRGQGFGPEVQRRILAGTFSLSSSAMDNYFIQAQKIRRLVQGDFDSVFRLRNPLHTRTPPSRDGVDYILCPTAPTPPPYLKHLPPKSSRPINPTESYTTDIFTVPASLAGLPALSVPAPLSPASRHVDHANIGIQLIGQYGDDEALLRFAQFALEPSRAQMMHYTRRGKKRFL